MFNKLNQMKSKVLPRGGSQSIRDEEINNLHKKVIEINSKVGDLCNKLDANINYVGSCHQDGLFLVEAWGRYAKRQLPSQQKLGRLGGKIQELQKIIEESEFNLQKALYGSVAEPLEEYVDGELREAKSVHVEFDKTMKSVENIEKQIASESKKGQSPKLLKLQQMLEVERKNAAENRDFAIYKMNYAINLCSSLSMSLLIKYINLYKKHYISLANECGRIITELDPEFQSPLLNKNGTIKGSTSNVQTFSDEQRKVEISTIPQQQTHRALPAKKQQETSTTSIIQQSNSFSRQSSGTLTTRSSFQQQQQRFEAESTIAPPKPLKPNKPISLSTTRSNVTINSSSMQTTSSMSGVGQQDTVQAPMKPTKPEFGRMQMGTNRANSRTQPQTQIQTRAKPMNRNCSNEVTKPRENTITRQFTELEKMLMDFEEPPSNNPSGSSPSTKSTEKGMTNDEFDEALKILDEI